MEKRSYPHLREEMYVQTLPNGLTVTVLPRRGFTKKLAYFLTDFGAVHTEFVHNGVPYSVPAGIAHYLEHKMFDMPDGEVSAKFAALGAEVNAFTGYDMTAYYFSCTEHFEEALKLLLTFVSTPYFTEESVQKEKGIIGQEIGMNEDNPDTRVFENLMRAMYEKHPITEPILGTKETIARITPEMLETCHDAFYRMCNMLLCVVGDVDAEAVCRIAEDSLPKEKKEKTCRTDSWEEKPTVKQTYTETKMEVSMPMFQLGFKHPAPKFGEAGARQEFVGDLAAEALFGESSALYLELYGQGVIDSSFGGGFETVGNMAMLTAAGDSNEPQKVREEILKRAKALCREGLSQEDFLRMKRSAVGRRIRAFDNFDSLCFRICAYRLCGFDYLKFPSVYEEITAEELLAFLHDTVREDNCALSVIYPT